MMANSSVVPGGGTSPETTLQILSECRGDFLVNIQLVLRLRSTALLLSVFLRQRKSVQRVLGYSWL